MATNPTELRRLRINRVSLVDKGANQAADIVLWKRDGGIQSVIRKMDAMTGEEPAATFEENISEMEGYQKADEAMSQLWPATDTLRQTIMGIFEKSKGDERKGLLKEAITQYLSHCKEKLAEIAKRSAAEKEGEMNEADIKKLLEPLTAQLTEATASITTLKSALDTERAANEELRKRLAGLPAETKPDTTPVTKAELSSLSKESREAIEKALNESKTLREQVEKLQREGELNLETQRIEKQYPAIAEQDAVGYAKLVLKHEKGSDERKAIEKLIEAANANNSETLREYGTQLRKGASETDPVAKLEAKALELRKADPKLSRSDAISEAYRLNPELAAEIEEER